MKPVLGDVPPSVRRYLATGAVDLRQAEAYTRRLAGSHYESFLVAGWFMPRDLRQPFCNIYAYCRIADDLGDEAHGDAALKLLDWWEGELEALYVGRPDHPVFLALQETNARFGIPIEPYRDLLRAFRQDQTKKRYTDRSELLDYCRCSANPVGRLVLHLGGEVAPEMLRMSDATCTALQLANFWQDVGRDHAIGRVYLPTSDMARHGVEEADIAGRRFTPAFAELLREECAWASGLFDEGAPLTGAVARPLRLPVALFTAAGREVLKAIARQGYDVLSSRPVVPKSRKARLLLEHWWGALWRR
ncbi:MAG: squalene synthase HpnC [Armatimonadetes bacterium]|nr:squalene synthase HpnC [Armatimonadota bacterium]